MPNCKGHFKKEMVIFNEGYNYKKQILIEKHLKQINYELDQMLDELKSDDDKKELIKKEALLLSNQITDNDVEVACS